MVVTKIVMMLEMVIEVMVVLFTLEPARRESYRAGTPPLGESPPPPLPLVLLQPCHETPSIVVSVAVTLAS